MGFVEVTLGILGKVVGKVGKGVHFEKGYGELFLLDADFASRRASARGRRGLGDSALLLAVLLLALFLLFLGLFARGFLGERLFGLALGDNWTRTL